MIIRLLFIVAFIILALMLMYWGLKQTPGLVFRVLAWIIGIGTLAYAIALLTVHTTVGTLL